MIHACSFETPVGPLTVLAKNLDRTPVAPPGADDEPVVVAAGFCPAQDLVERLPADEATEIRVVRDLGPLQEPIRRYLDGDVSAIDRLAVAQQGTELQQEVWDRLRAIPPGETRTYSELAGATSKPKAVRAVGSACGRNLIAPFVPCHRALRSDGSLGGYYYGLDVKRWLLDHESTANRLPLESLTR